MIHSILAFHFDELKSMQAFYCLIVELKRCFVA